MRLMCLLLWAFFFYVCVHVHAWVCAPRVYRSSDRFEAPSSTHPPTSSTAPSGPSSDLERRVTTLETKLERLTETFLSSQQNPRGATSPTGGSRFWYVVTFAGWMMVPLIVVCMYQFKNK